MGLTLIAILTAALLLPGIIAARSFYHASKTGEVEPSIPALSSMDGIALVGLFSVIVHFVYATGLVIAMSVPSITTMPAANPYQLFTTDAGHLSGLHAAFSLFFGLIMLCLTALVSGYVGGRLVMRWGDKSVFYGSLADIIASGEGEQRFITAYVLTKVRHDARAIGYQGTVVSLIRDADRFPTKILLKNVSVFYLDFDGPIPVRKEHADPIDWIALSKDDWDNIAFKVFKVFDDVDAADSQGASESGLLDQVTARR